MLVLNYQIEDVMHENKSKGFGLGAYAGFCKSRIHGHKHIPPCLVG